MGAHLMRRLIPDTHFLFLVEAAVAIESYWKVGNAVQQSLYQASSLFWPPAGADPGASQTTTRPQPRVCVILNLRINPISTLTALRPLKCRATAVLASTSTIQRKMCAPLPVRLVSVPAMNHARNTLGVLHANVAYDWVGNRDNPSAQMTLDAAVKCVQFIYVKPRS